MVQLDDYVVDVLMRDLIGHDHRPACIAVYIWMAAEFQRKGGAVPIGYRELAENIGLSKSATQSAVAWLMRRKLLSATHKNATAIPSYTVHAPWRRHR